MTEHDITHMDEMIAMQSRLWGLATAIRGLTPLDQAHAGVIQLAEDVAEKMEAVLDNFQESTGLGKLLGDSEKPLA